MTDLDRATLDRVLPTARGPADWGDVMSRFRAHQARRRRRLVALAAAALVVAVGTASAFGTVRDLFPDRGFIGLPPEGATPSAPKSGELVLHWLGRSATHARPHWRGGYVAPLVRVWVYADGRMIWSREGSIPAGANEVTSGYLEQRLTPEGVALLRSRLVATGLFDRSLTLVFPRGTEKVPMPLTRAGEPVSCPQAEIRRGDAVLRLRCVGPEDPDARGRTRVTLDQLSALRRVDALFTDTASAMPASAWAVREVRAYVPSHYAVCMDTSPPKDASQLLSLLPARAADVLRGTNRTRFDGEVVEAREAGRTVVLGRSVTYCSKLATEEAREVAEALSGLDRDRRFHNVILGYRLAEPVNNLNATSIWFEPYFPHGEYTCSACG